MISMTQSQFFEVLGYLASPTRKCKLDAEVPNQSKTSFESDYTRITGITSIVPNNHNYYLLSPTVDKWGLELRIYFVRNNNIPNSISARVVRPRGNRQFNSRLNDNDFIWDLIRYGFLLSDSQNVQGIRALVPATHLADFNRGFSL